MAMHLTRSQLKHFPWFTFYILSLTSVNSEDSERPSSWTDSSHLGEGEKQVKWLTLFQNAIGAYFKSIEAVKIRNLCGTLAFTSRLVAACERRVDELKDLIIIVIVVQYVIVCCNCNTLMFLSHLDHTGLQCQIKLIVTLFLNKLQRRQLKAT